MQLRAEITAKGLDAGADTIAWHLHQHHQRVVSRATIYRTLRRAGLAKVEPKKRPKSSYIRFQADLPNECWQSDFTHWRLADGSDVEILDCLVYRHAVHPLAAELGQRSRMHVEHPPVERSDGQGTDALRVSAEHNQIRAPGVISFDGWDGQVVYARSGRRRRLADLLRQLKRKR